MQFLSSIQNPLPENLVEIFFHLPINHLGFCTTVSKNWEDAAKVVFKMKKIALYPKFFSPVDWDIHFSNNGITEEEKKFAFNSLPPNIDEIPCPIDPSKMMIDTHIFTYFPKDICLDRIAKLLKQKGIHCIFGTDENLKNTIYDFIPLNFEFKAIEKSGWKAMSKEILPGSLCKGLKAHSVMVAGLNKGTDQSFKMPTALEAVICISAELFKNNNMIFSKNLTRCNVGIDKYRSIVIFDKEDFVVSACFDSVYRNVGVASLREF